MDSPKQNAQNVISKKRELQLKIAGIFLPVLLLAVIEIFLRTFNYDGSLKLFINHPDELYQNYKMVNPEIGRKYFSKNQHTKAGNDIFLKEKPDSSFRIFVMGSSTAIGFPYNRNMMFSRILHHRLQEAYPSIHVEMINTAITAINSYTLLDYIDEILKEEPDAILIYAGHNEFYGAYGIGSNETTGRNSNLTMLHLNFMNLRLYRLFRNTFTSARKTVARSVTETDNGTLMKQMVNNPTILYNSTERNITFSQFEANISKIVKKTQKKKVPIILSELICNLNGLEPFISVDTNIYPKAIDVYTTAQNAEKNGEYKQAKQLYKQARDLDALPFRAPSEINTIIHKIGDKYDVPVVAMEKVFDNNSPNGIVGNNLLTEHVHPNQNGYMLMSEAFYNEIIQQKLISEKLNELTTKSFKYFSHSWGFTPLDGIMAYHSITLLKSQWPFTNTLEGNNEQLTFNKMSPYDSIAISVITREMDIIRAYSLVAKSHENKKDYYSAYRYYNALVKMTPYDIAANMEAARCAYMNNDLAKALLHLETCLKIQETYSTLFYSGEIYLIKHAYKKAEYLLNKAHNISTNNDEKLQCQKKLHQLYSEQNNQKKADQMLLAIRSLEPSYQPEQINKEFTFSNYIPREIQAYINKASSSMSKGRSSDALNTLLKATEINDASIVNLMIGNIHVAMKNNNKALYYYLKVYNDYLNEPNYLDRLIYLHIMDDNHDEAMYQLKRLRFINPEYPSIAQIEKILYGI